MRRHLFRDDTALLHAGPVRREDHDGHDDSDVTQHLPAARRRDQPVHVARDAADRQVPALHHGTGGRRHRRDGARAESPHARRQLSRDVDVGRRTVPQSSTSPAVHAAAARPHLARKQIRQGASSLYFQLL